CCQEVFETSRHLFLGDGVSRSPSHTCARLSSTLDWNVEWLAGQQAADELLDAGTDLVAHRADFRDALAGWVLGFPVLVPLAGVVGAGVAASHGDDHVGGLDELGGEDLRLLVGDLDAVPGELPQPPGCHLGSTGVVDTDEQDAGASGHGSLPTGGEVQAMSRNARSSAKADGTTE